MRIAILTQYFDPEPAIKLTALVHRLVADGHRVEVLTSLPNLPHGRLYKGYRFAGICRDDRLGATVFRTFVWPYRGRTMWKRIVHMASFTLSAALYSGRLRDFDLLYVYHPPLTISIPAYLLTLRRRVPMLYDVQDLWPEAGLAAGAIRPGFLYWLMTKWARIIYDRADHLTVLAPEFKAGLVDAGISPAKVSVIPNWTDESCFEPKPAAGVRARFGLPEEPFVVMYAGNFGSSHGVDVILEAARLLRDDSRILFALSGSGAEYGSAVERCKQLGLDNVKFLGYFEHRSDLPWLYACADLMIVHLLRSPAGAVSVPSRIVSFMACARPILACCEGAPRNLVENAGCGIMCEPESPTAMVEAILRAAKDKGALERMGDSGRQFYLNNLSQARTLDRLSSLLASLTEGKGTPAGMRGQTQPDEQPASTSTA